MGVQCGLHIQCLFAVAIDLLRGGPKGGLTGSDQRRLLGAADGVWTRFRAAVLKSLYDRMRPLRRSACPFANLPEKRQGRWTQNITPREMSRCIWVEPRFVCQVRFSEWTRDAKLRHPVFLGLREDKAAREVTRERPIQRAS